MSTPTRIEVDPETINGSDHRGGQRFGDGVDPNPPPLDFDTLRDVRRELLRTIANPQVTSGRLAFEARLVERARSRCLRSAAGQRAFDVLVAGTVVVALAPLLAITALLIRVTSRGPLIFRQTRVGQRGEPFTCLKFRTMRIDAEGRLAAILLTDDDARHAFETTFKLDDDPRITRLGHFLRRTSLDELPQLINVLRGDMSIVGPRPVVPEELGRYGDFGQVVLQVRPGMTGAWQVNGRSAISYPERIQLDVAYALTRSISGDIDILRRTVKVILASDPGTAR